MSSLNDLVQHIWSCLQIPSQVASSKETHNISTLEIWTIELPQQVQSLLMLMNLRWIICEWRKRLRMPFMAMEKCWTTFQKFVAASWQQERNGAWSPWPLDFSLASTHSLCYEPRMYYGDGCWHESQSFGVKHTTICPNSQNPLGDGLLLQDLPRAALPQNYTKCCD